MKSKRIHMIPCRSVQLTGGIQVIKIKGVHNCRSKSFGQTLTFCDHFSIRFGPG